MVQTSTQSSQKRLGVVFGSRSVEHEVSIITATQMMKHIDTEKYEIVPFYIDKSGRWWSGKSLVDVKAFQDLDLHNPHFDEAVHQIVFDPDPTAEHPVDVAIFCTHGGFGEDGTLAGLFELAGIPYAAPGVVSAAVAIDKIITKLVAEQSGISVTPYVWFTSQEWNDEEKRSAIKEQVSQFAYPLFVKPAGLGSSVGVTRVKNWEELLEAVELVQAFDTRILIEQGAHDCLEVNVSVIGNADSLQVSVTEQPIKTDEFLTYSDKYERGGGKKGKSSGMASLSRRIPAPLAPETQEKVAEQARLFWKTVGGSGVARIDFFVNPTTEEVFLQEANCPPGSMAFYLWEATGVPYSELIEKLVQAAEERHQQRQNLMQSVQSNILKQQNG